jgi:hypothetical protein
MESVVCMPYQCADETVRFMLPAEGDVSSVELRSPLVLILVPTRIGLMSLYFVLQPAMLAAF